MEIEQMQKREPLSGAARFLSRIVYAPPEEKDACILYFAATHGVAGLNTIGRLLVTSPDHGAGKTTVLDAAAMMCQNPWMADPTKWALQSKFMEPDQPTPLMDEISQVFGPNGTRGRGNPLYKPLVEGYRKTATMSVSIDRTATDISSFCACVMAGKGPSVAPEDLRSRCVIIRMRPAPSTVELEDSLDAGVEADGKRIGEQMHSWVSLVADDLADMARTTKKKHPALRGRKLQVWGSLFAMADLAGGDWPKRCMAAFMKLALAKSERPVLSAEEQVLWDAGHYLNDSETPPSPYLTSAELLKYLRSLDEAIYTTKTDSQVARLMSAGLGRAGVLTLPDRKTVRGWHAQAILALYDELVALVQPEPQEEEPDEFDDFFDEVYDAELEEEQWQDDEDQTTETTETTDRSAA